MSVLVGIFFFLQFNKLGLIRCRPVRLGGHLIGLAVDSGLSVCEGMATNFICVVAYELELHEALTPAIYPKLAVWF